MSGPAEELTHNRNNEVTVGIWRHGDEVRKVLGPPRGAAGAAGWAASHDARHWNYWRREALVYTTGLPARLGLASPALLAPPLERGDGYVELRLEWVDGRSGHGFGVDDVAATALALGRSQGRGAAVDEPWLSRGFVRAYVASKAVDAALLSSEEAWSQPLVIAADVDVDAWRDAALVLWRERERLFQVLESSPRAVCHLDVWPNNVVRRSGGGDGGDDGDAVFLDWSFVGDGAVGEDVGNLVPDSVFDLFLPSAALPALEAAALDAYLRGLREARWRGDDRAVVRAVHASAVKYAWLTPLMLASASLPQQDYGGAELAAGAAHRLAERARTIIYLSGWASDALSG